MIKPRNYAENDFTYRDTPISPAIISIWLYTFTLIFRSIIFNQPYPFFPFLRTDSFIRPRSSNLFGTKVGQGKNASSVFARLWEYNSQVQRATTTMFTFFAGLSVFWSMMSLDSYADTTIFKSSLSCSEIYVAH